MSSQFVWEQIDRLRDTLPAGAHITCSQFGRVMPIRSREGYIGRIPEQLQAVSLQHGMQVIDADYMSDIYTLEVLPRLNKGR